MFKKILSIGGSLLGAFGKAKAARDERDAARENARVAEKEAERQRRRTALELERQRKTARRVVGRQRAEFAMAGVGATGSALDIIADSAAEAALDASLIEEGGRLAESYALAQARQDRDRGRAVFQGGLLSAGSHLLKQAHNQDWFA
ncbi:MAG: hypothetical protein ACTS3R_07815 [Inquilinaceae bacterium]